MLNNEIIDYIKSELARGVSRQEIKDSLIKVGWQNNDVQEAFNAFFTPASSVIAPPQSTEGLITEKNYPITKLWIFKTPIIIILMNIVALFFGYYFPYLVLALPIMLIANPLIRANFHYSLDDKYFHVREGVISKKQRNLPYGVIQNVFVKQDVLDRIFGLASLRVENASSAGDRSNVRWWNKSYGLKSNTYGQQEGLGSSGNKVNLPGLKKQSAEALKTILLQKMKENPVEESGL